MNLKKLLSILCLFALLLNTSSAYAIMAANSKEDMYSKAIEGLETYLETPKDNNAMLVGLLSTFVDLGSYEYSNFFAYYVSALKKVANEEYDYELYTTMDILSANNLFAAHLNDLRSSSSIGTIDELKTYVSAREDEYNGNKTQAREKYYQCINFFDASDRYIKMPVPEPYDYTVAKELLSQKDFVGAYFSFANANGYGDSAEMMENIVNLLGYTPESPNDHLLSVSGLSIASASKTAITLAWEPAKHAKVYEVSFKLRNQSLWTAFSETDSTYITINGLDSGADYDFKVVSAIGAIKSQEAIVSGKTLSDTPTSAPTPAPKPTPSPTSTPAPTLKPVSSCDVGDIVKVGHYPQTNSGNDRTPVEWVVLDIDRSNGRALLISRYLLEPMAYSNKYPSTWGTSSLRSWLNGSFLDSAFSYDEQQAIIETTVDNSKSQGNSTWNADGGKNTKDKLFILSYEEARKYFGFNGNGKCILTDYTMRRGRDYCLISDTERLSGKPTGWWWLRSPGMDQSTAMCMCDNGASRSYGITVNRICVRPVFWVDLSAGIF